MNVTPENGAATAPSTNEGKRRRAVVACTSCRRRKIRCDASKPQCSNCIRAAIECVYPPEGRRKRVRVVNGEQYNNVVHSRLNRMESMSSSSLEKEGIKMDNKNKYSHSNGGDLRAPSYSPNGSDSCSLSDSDNSDNGDPEDEEDDVGIDDSRDIGGAEKHDQGSFSGGAVNDDPRDVSKLKARRSPFVSRYGEFEPLVAYSYGFTSSSSSPKGMRWLCTRIGNETLGRDAESSLSSLWKRKADEMNKIGRQPHDLKPMNPILIEKGLESRENTDSEVFKLLIDAEDVNKIQKICNPHNDYSKLDEDSPYSILYPALIMASTSPKKACRVELSAFTPEYIAEQNLNAYKICMQKVSQSTWYPTTFLLLRILILVTYIMSQNAAFSQIRSMSSVAISRSLDSGLHRGEGSRYLSPVEQKRRALVWALVQDLDVKMSSISSLMPLMINLDYEPHLLQRDTEDPDSDLNISVESMGLNHIYAEVYLKLFSTRARKQSVKQMLVNAVQLDRKSNEWKDSLSPTFRKGLELLETKEELEKAEIKSQLKEKHFSAIPESNDRNTTKNIKKNIVRCDRELCSSWLSTCTMVCFYNIKMLIYSIPAFSPSCLNVFDKEKDGVPPQLLNSINNISEAAKNTLKYAFSARALYNPEFSAAVATNSFSASFLKQIRDPLHPSNNEDLIQIYRYITRFEQYAERSRRVDIHGIIKVWSIFSSALTQSNQEYSKKRDSLDHGVRCAAHNAATDSAGTSKANSKGTADSNATVHSDKKSTPPNNRADIGTMKENATASSTSTAPSSSYQPTHFAPPDYARSKDPQEGINIPPQQQKWTTQQQPSPAAPCNSVPHHFQNQFDKGKPPVLAHPADASKAAFERGLYAPIPAPVYPLQTPSPQFVRSKNVGSENVNEPGVGLPMSPTSNLHQDVHMMNQHPAAGHHPNDPFDLSYGNSQWISPDGTGNLWDTFSGSTGSGIEEQLFNQPSQDDIYAGDAPSNCTIC